MSSSDPASNLDSLNLSTGPMDVPTAVGEAASNRSASSTLRRARSKSGQGQGQGRRNMSQVFKSLPKGHDSGRRLAVASTGNEVGLETRPSQLPSGLPSSGAQSSVHNKYEYHDQRSQQVHGVDPMVFSNMVAKARRVIQESEDKTQGLEQLAQEIYQQTCTRIQELVGLAESLYQSDSSKTSDIEKLQQDVQSTRDQPQNQINRNKTLDFQIAQFESRMSNVQNLFGHKDAEINRLVSEVSYLRSSEARLEERLAALSAAPSVAAPNIEAQMRPTLVHSVPGNLVGTVDGRVVEGSNDPVANDPVAAKTQERTTKKNDLCLFGVLGPAFHFIRVIRTLNTPNILFTAFVSKFGHHQPLR